MARRTAGFVVALSVAWLITACDAPKPLVTEISGARGFATISEEECITQIIPDPECEQYFTPYEAFYPEFAC